MMIYPVLSKNTDISIWCDVFNFIIPNDELFFGARDYNLLLAQSLMFRSVIIMYVNISFPFLVSFRNTAVYFMLAILVYCFIIFVIAYIYI